VTRWGLGFSSVVKARVKTRKNFIQWISRKPKFRFHSAGYLSWDSAGSWSSSFQLGLTYSTAKSESGNVLFYSSIYIKRNCKICHFLTYKYSFHHPRYFSYFMYEFDYFGNAFLVYHNLSYQNGDRKSTELQHVYTLCSNLVLT